MSAAWSRPLSTWSLDERSDLLMCVILTSYALGAGMLASTYGDWTSALLIGLPLLAAGWSAMLMAHATIASRMVISLCLMGMVALHIDLGLGMAEYHFGVFVTLALLLMYRDWRPILAAALAIAVHHVLIDRLQAQGVGVYCLAKPDFGRILLHAFYVVLQTAVELRIAVLLGHSEHEMKRLGESLSSRMAQQEQMISDVRDALSGVRIAAQEIGQGADDLSERSEHAAAELSTTRQRLQSLNQATEHTAQATRQVTGLARQSAMVAQDGGQVVSQVVSTMDEIQASSRRIADIITVIDGIAFQTNILALNAAVEAARAGEQGRGFAVVASEVRTLAARSAEAAKEIKGLISASVERVEAGTQRVHQAGQTMEDIVSAANRVAQMIQEIADDTAQQQDGLKEIHDVVGHLDDAVRQNARLVEQSRAATAQLGEQAQRLAQAAH